MEVKCFNVETIEYTDKSGNKRVLYKVWFNLSSGLGWLLTDKPVSAGSAVKLDLAPMATNDTKTNMRLSLKIV